VAKLFVPRFEHDVPQQNAAGKQRYHGGTGWLITEQLIVTNLHVINARAEGESDATPSDLLLQAAGTVARFDYHTAVAEVTDLTVKELEACDRDLDYAVLRLATPAKRGPLRLAPGPVKYAPGYYTPVNIIQHPNGRYMR
jgi:hypothetical protein